MAKRVVPPAPLTRKQISRREREQRQQKMLLIGAAAVFAVVVLILGWGLYDMYVIRPSRPVATVHGTPIRLDTYQKLVRYRRADYRGYLQQLEAQSAQLDASDPNQSFYAQYLNQQIQQIRNQLMGIATSVLDELIDAEIVRKASAERGITVTSEEIDLFLEQQFDYDRNPSASETTPITATEAITVTPVPTTAPVTEAEYKEQLQAFFQRAKQNSGFTETDFRRLVETSLLRDKLEEALTADAPTTGDQVHARHILVATREEAEDALARLGAGEDFDALAAELSTDESNREKGGDLGWFARGMMVAPFEEVAFALQPGEVSDVVETSFGFHVIRVDDRSAQEQAVADWFAAQRVSPDVVRSWNSTMVPADK
jgi:parvulin-like peptidyl-prolyl isomerase